MGSLRGTPAGLIRLLACCCAVTVLLLSLTACGGGQTAVPDVPTAAIINSPSAAVPTALATDNAALPQPPSATVGIPVQVVADLQAGRALVQAQCAACHALVDAGLTGASPQIAPALDAIGRRRSRHWLEVQLVDPCAHPHAGGDRFSCRRMPGYGGLTQQQRDQVVQYLLSQR